MQEKYIEQTFKKAVEQHGGLCLKIDATHLAGIPDRLVLLPGGTHAFVETKAPGKKPRPIQQRRHDQLRAIGHRVYTLDNTNNIESLIHEIRST